MERTGAPLPTAGSGVPGVTGVVMYQQYSINSNTYYANARDTRIQFSLLSSYQILYHQLKWFHRHIIYMETCYTSIGHHLLPTVWSLHFFQSAYFTYVKPGCNDCHMRWLYLRLFTAPDTHLLLTLLVDNSYCQDNTENPVINFLGLYRWMNVLPIIQMLCFCCENFWQLPMISFLSSG